MGGDRAPDAVVDGALLVLEEQPGVEVVLVGPSELAATLLADRGAQGRFGLSVVGATQIIGMDEDPARAVRTKRDAGVRVAARLVRDGKADATVSVGSTGAAMAAALFTLGRLPGMTRPALAVVVPSLRAPLVLLDVGATTEAGPDLLAQFALAGAAMAQVRLGLAAPRVGLLSNGEEQGKGDALRKAAYAALTALPLDFIGNVEGSDVPFGGVADVVVTDGFTGNVLLKGLEGAFDMLAEALAGAFTSTAETRAAAKVLLPAMAAATAHMAPERLGGALLLGVGGVAVVGHGSSTPRAVAACVEVAVQAVREGLVPRTAAALRNLVEARAAAGETSPPDPGAVPDGAAARQQEESA